MSDFRNVSPVKKGYGLGAYLGGAVAARTGDEMSGPALMLAGYALTGGAARASTLLAGLTVSAAAGGPLLGALLDRRERPGRLLAAALVLYAAGLALVLATLGRVPFPVTVSAAALTGLLAPALSGGWTAQLPRAVPPHTLPRANALDALTFTLATLAGPALAATAAQTLGAPMAVALSAALVAAAAPAAWHLPARGRPGRPAGPAAGPGASVARDLTGGPRRPGPAGRAGRRTGAVASVARDLAEGLRVLRDSRALARVTGVSVGCCAAQGMAAGCLPLLGERVLGGAGRGAALLSCTAVAALGAGAVMARFPRAVRPETVVVAGAVVQAAALALAALAVPGRPGLLVAAFALAGVGEGPQLTALFAVRHREAPESSRSRVFTTGASLKLTGYAAGAAVAGPLATRSLPAALTAAASMAALAAAAGPPLGRRTAPGTGEAA